MSEIKIFSNPVFGNISEIEINNEPMFIGSEIASILGYSNPQKAVRDHIDEDDKQAERIVLSGQTREVVLINESGLYSLVLRSQLPTAKQFKNWVTKEVLPTIRKHGVYATESFVEKAISDPDAMIIVLTELKVERQQRLVAESKAALQEEINLHNMPRVRFAQAVETSSQSCLVAELAKIITQNGFEIGQNRLFSWMRSNGYMGKTGEHHNIPTQTAMGMGLFEIKKTSITKPDGTVLVSTTPKVTGKGQVYFVNKFKKGLEA